MAKKDENKTEDADPFKDIPHVRKEPRPDFSAPLPHVKLPASIEKTLNDDEQYWVTFTEGKWVLP